MPNVIQRYYDGLIKDEDLLAAIQKAVEEWHSIEEDGVPLYTFLGMCLPEYELFINYPNKFVKQMHHQSYHPMFWGVTD